ncbi:MAG: MarR family transcriptional regulator [Candidatus Heimdallarchaeota archaeon]|nr:MAG: MarR family transcriptional regulator [Candidatus Heimdallarchaeota archaeon]
MLDLLASTGTKEILEFIRNQSQPIRSTDIDKHFTEKGATIPLKTATIYRRLKELELAGFIIRQPPGSNTFILTPQAEDILDRQILQHPEITELKRSHRALLHQIKQNRDVNVVELQEKAKMSPTTINVGLQKLSSLGLIKPEYQLEKKIKGPGRPKKRHKLTKKGEKVYKAQKKLEQAK